MTPGRQLLATIALTLVIGSPARAGGWLQWGRTAAHDGAASVRGQSLRRIAAEVVIDPFIPDEKALAGGDVLIHYPAPLVDGDDVFLLSKSGTFTSSQQWDTQRWNVRKLRWNEGALAPQWSVETDWRPVPAGGPSWEPVYHFAVGNGIVWAPGAGGTVLAIDRQSGAIAARLNPFGTEIDADSYVAGPLTIDSNGSVVYTVIQLDPAAPWSRDVTGAWLVRASANGSTSRVSFSTLAAGAPGPGALCTTQFASSDLPFPPAPDAIAPTRTCGSQRPGINVAPAIAPDGTIYVVSRAHFADRYGYLLAVNGDLTPKWSASLRNRFHDGCDAGLPPSGSPGGCRPGASPGVDPSDNLPGSGRVVDNSTSSPVVGPDGSIFYGAYTRYNFSQGHLMHFAATGAYLGAYGFGWDITPAIFRHDATYSVVLKENRYATGSYCSVPAWCPPDRSATTPNDPERYTITQLSSALAPEWQYRNTNTLSCERDANGAMQCTDDHPDGFEWCVNAVAVDHAGVVFANSEDGNLYAIRQGGVLRDRIFLRLAEGAAYTPLSIGSDGKIYTQNDGRLFVVSGGNRRRPIVRP